MTEKEISYSDFIRFFYSKKLIVLSTIIITLLSAFLYDIYEIGKIKHKAMLQISINTQQNDLTSKTFFFNYTIKKLINASEFKSIIQTIEGNKSLIGLLPELDDDVVNKLHIDSGFYIQTLRKFNFSFYNENIQAHNADGDPEVNVTWHLHSYDLETLEKAKYEIKEEMQDLLKKEVTDIYKLAFNFNQELRDGYLNRIKYIKTLRQNENKVNSNEEIAELEKTHKRNISNLKYNHAKLVQHIKRELNMAKKLGITNVDQDNSRNFSNLYFIKKGDYIEEIPYYFGYTHKDGLEKLEIIKTYVESIDINTNIQLMQDEFLITLQALKNKHQKISSEIDSYIDAIESFNVSEYDVALNNLLDSLDFTYSFIIAGQDFSSKYLIYLIGFLSGLFISFVIVFSLLILKYEK